MFQGNSYLTARIWAYEKPARRRWEPAAPAGFSFGSSSNPLPSADGDIVFTPVPAQAADGGPNAYVTAADFPEFGPAGQLMVWHVSGGGGGGSPSLVSDGNANVPSYNFPLNVPQPSSSRVLDSLDTRLTQAVAMSDPDVAGAKGIWSQHTVDGPGTPSVVRWYELVPSLCNGTTCPAAALKQAGTVCHPLRLQRRDLADPQRPGRGDPIQPRQRIAARTDPRPLAHLTWRPGQPQATS